MKRLILFVFFLHALTSSFAGTSNTTKIAEGIKFESNLTWEQIFDKAKSENKFVFVDCFATWCAPCKFMSENVFTTKAVGDYMNSHFVCVSVQMDRTQNDDPAVKNWYNKADSIGKEYSITEYPTYLFFSPEGQPVHRIIGSTGSDANDFIKAASNALDNNGQYYALIGQYENHLNDTAYLKKVLKKALSLSDKDNAEKIMNAYVVSANMDVNKLDIGLVFDATRSSKDKSFGLLLDNADQLERQYGKPGLIDHLIYSILNNEDLKPLFATTDSVISWVKFHQQIKNKYPKLNDKTLAYLNVAFGNQVRQKELAPLYGVSDNMDANWGDLSEKIARRYPGFDASKIIDREKMRYYYYKHLWTESGKAAIAYLDKYGDHSSVDELNNILWDYVFMHCDNKRLLSQGIYWGHRMVDSAEAPLNKADGLYGIYDTYANLIYKAGKRDEAIKYEQKAIDAGENKASPKHQKSFKITIERMKKGLSTTEGRNQHDDYEI